MSAQKNPRLLSHAFAFVTLIAGCSSTSTAGDAGNDASSVDTGVATDASGSTDAGSTADVASTDATGSTDAGMDTDAASLVAARPYHTKIPTAYDNRTAWPLIILLHGYSADAVTQDTYFQLGAQVDAKGFLYAYPDGSVDTSGNRYWNADDACCNFNHTNVDDVAYITAIIDDMSARYHVDPKKVFIVGHSNGAFMSHRMACDRSDRIAAIVALAGDVWLDASRCAPTSTVSVLQVHGTADAVILYNGGDLTSLGGARYPAAMTSVSTWSTLNGCSPLLDTGMTMDLEGGISGEETHVFDSAGCRAGGAAQLWSMMGASHIPAFNASWAPSIVDWLFAHPKP